MSSKLFHVFSQSKPPRKKSFPTLIRIQILGYMSKWESLLLFNILVSFYLLLKYKEYRQTQNNLDHRRGRCRKTNHEQIVSENLTHKKCYWNSCSKGSHDSLNHNKCCFAISVEISDKAEKE